MPYADWTVSMIVCACIVAAMKTEFKMRPTEKTTANHDVRDGKLTKGVRFQGNVDIGDPVDTAQRYYPYRYAQPVWSAWSSLIQDRRSQRPE